MYCLLKVHCRTLLHQQFTIRQHTSLPGHLIHHNIPTTTKHNTVKYDINKFTSLLHYYSFHTCRNILPMICNGLIHLLFKGNYSNAVFALSRHADRYHLALLLVLVKETISNTRIYKRITDRHITRCCRGNVIKAFQV